MACLSNKQGNYSSLSSLRRGREPRWAWQRATARGCAFEASDELEMRGKNEGKTDRFEDEVDVLLGFGGHFHEENVALLGVLLGELFGDFSLGMRDGRIQGTFIARSHLLPARAITISGFPAKNQGEREKGTILLQLRDPVLGTSKSCLE